MYCTMMPLVKYFVTNVTSYSNTYGYSVRELPLEYCVVIQTTVQFL